MIVALCYFPEDICQQYNLFEKVHYDSIFIKIKKVILWLIYVLTSLVLMNKIQSQIVTSILSSSTIINNTILFLRDTCGATTFTVTLCCKIILHKSFSFFLQIKGIIGSLNNTLIVKTLHLSFLLLWFTIKFAFLNSEWKSI